MNPIRLRVVLRPPLPGEQPQILPIHGLLEITVDDENGPQIRNVRTHGVAERDNVASVGPRLELEVIR